VQQAGTKVEVAADSAALMRIMMAASAEIMSADSILGNIPGNKISAFRNYSDKHGKGLVMQGNYIFT